MSTVKALYFLFFSVLFLLLLLLGESYLVLGIHLGFFLLFFVSRKHCNFKAFSSHKKEILLWLVFLSSQFFATIFTHSVPLSISSIEFYFFFFILYLHLISIKKEFMSFKEYVLIFILTSLVLSIVSFAFVANPQWAEKLPGMNLIYATYGHNHLATLLMMIMPFSWAFCLEKWQLLRGEKTIFSKMKLQGWQKKVQSNYLFVLPIFFLLIIFMSFARGVLFLSFVELLIILSYVYLYTKQRKIIVTSGVIVVAFLLVIIVSLYYTIGVNPNTDCPISALSFKLCKPIAKESRLEYWRQAATTMTEYVLTGYGPGTFSLISQKYKSFPSRYSAFAHNAFLQQFAESGVIGGVAFLSLMVYQLYDIVKKTVKNSQKDYFLLASILAIATSYGIALIDFDWTFQGIFFLLISLIALHQKTLKKDSSKKNLGDQKQTTFFLFNVFCVSGVIFCSLFVLTEVLLQLHLQREAFFIFPYFIQQEKIYMKTNKLSAAQRLYFHQLYLHHPDSYEIDVKILQNPEQLIEIDPWRVLISEELQLKILATTIQPIPENQLNNLIKLTQQDEENKTFIIPWNIHYFFIEQFLRQGEESFKVGKPEEAAKLYIKAFQIDPWSFVHHAPPFLKHSLPLEKKCMFIQGLASIDGKYFGDYRDQFARLYLDCFFPITHETSYQNNEMLATRILSIADWLSYDLWDDMSIYYESELNAAFKREDSVKMKQLLNDWLKMYKLISTQKSKETGALNTSLLLQRMEIVRDKLKESGDKDSEFNNQLIKL